MGTLEEKVAKTIKIVNKSFGGSKEVKAFERSNKEFKELVQKGLAKERGNNLLSSSDAHMKTQVYFNIR